jgi:DNA-binding NarL/FixJ family response regulator
MVQHVQVLIADYEVHTRQGLQALLAVWPEIEVVGMAANGIEAVQLVEKCRPDVALMDIPMPVLDDKLGNGAERMDGLEAIRLIKSRWPQVRIVVLTMYPTHRAAALAAGADAFLLKGCPAEALRDAILKTRQEEHLSVKALPILRLLASEHQYDLQYYESQSLHKGGEQHETDQEHGDALIEHLAHPDRANRIVQL